MKNCTNKFQIKDINSKGQGVAEREDGKIVFINGALPGEVVTASVFLEKKNYAIASLIEIERDVSFRVKPACKWFPACGGCQLQHMSYEMQLKVKSKNVENCFSKIAGLDVGSVPCEASPSIWGYRNKASFPVRFPERDCGFFESGSHKLVPVDNCPVLDPKINSIYRSLKNDFLPSLSKIGNMFYNEKSHKGLLRHLILRSTRSGDMLLMPVVTTFRKNRELGIFSSELERFLSDSLNISTGLINLNNKRGNKIIGDRVRIMKGGGVLTETLSGFKLSYDGGSFFQVNPDQAEQLFNYTASVVGDNVSAVELYCGVGALTAFLSYRCRKIYAVEEWTPAVDRLKANMKDNGINNVVGVVGRAEDKLSELISQRPETIVVDPPRSGCKPEVLSAMKDSSATRIVYVSCNPSTLARDVKIMLDGGFSVVSVKSFDLFPHTSHVETVVLLER